MAKNPRDQTIFHLSLLLLIVSSEQASFDYFQVVLQWQPATCSDIKLRVRCSKTPENRLSIHGVWPSKTSGAVVGPCSGSAFDPNKIVSIRAGLNQNWPDVINGRNQAFWSEEWRKHGTCSEEFFNQLQYFSFALNVYAKQAIVEILRKKNIRPDGNKYKKTEVEKAIISATGKRPGLRCNNDKSNRKQLHEFSLCYSKNAQTLEDCPSNASKCPTNFKWSSYKKLLMVAE